MKHPFKINNQNELRLYYKIFYPIILPTFEVFSNPTIKLDDIKARRFSIIDRCKP